MSATNRFYENTLAASVGSSIKSAAIKAQLAAIQAAFDAVQSELNASAAITGITGLGGFMASFAGSGLKPLRINAAESSVEATFSIPIVAVTASRDLAITDVGCLLACNSASPIILTLQPYATVPIESESPMIIAQIGAGKVTIVAGGGVTLVSSGSLFSTNGQGAQITLLMISSNTALIGGDRAV
jgi:hypothetical protein